MKKNITILLIIITTSSFSQLVGEMQMDEYIEGLCKQKVYVLFNGFEKQKEAKCLLTDEEIAKIINNKVTFLKDKLKFRSKGMISVYINCKGEPIGWRLSIKTKSKELDDQLLEAFKSLNKWESGVLNGKKVDTEEFISFKIKKGKLYID